MIKILCVSSMPPKAPCGVVTYYKTLYGYFFSDPEIIIQLISVEDASWLGKKIAGLVRRLISLFSFNNKKVVKFSVDINYRLMIFFALRRRKYKDCHLIHAQDILSGCAAKLFYKRKLPLILTCHFNDNPVEEDILRYGFGLNDRNYLANTYKQQFTEVDKFIFVSKYAYEKSKYLLNSASEVEVIYNGVNFLAVEDKKSNNELLEIINVGSIEERKNQRILISIAKKFINENILNFHITIVGNGPDLPLLKNLINDSGLNNYFSFPGWVTNVDEYLKKANLYIHTSINDNCPYSIIEAISKQVPVIAFSVGGIPEMLSKEFLFKLNDYKSISEFIIQNRCCFQDIGIQQYNKNAQTFSIEHQFKRTKEAYLSFREN